jgi:hypothetical protein
MYANAGNVLDHPRAELDQALAYHCEFSVRQWVRLRDGGAHAMQQPERRGMEDEPHLIGGGAVTRHTIRGELRLVHLGPQTQLEDRSRRDPPSLGRRLQRSTRHRHLKTFARKRDADAYHAQVTVDDGAGIHTADSGSITVTQAGKLWLASRKAAGVERATLINYREHLDLHITPLIGATKLAVLSVPFVREFEDKLRQDRSQAMVSLPTLRTGDWWRRTSSATAAPTRTAFQMLAKSAGSK